MAEDRPLTPGEIALARSVYGDAIDYAPVRIVRRKWAFFQPRDTVMAPSGTIHFHPRGSLCRDDFCTAAADLQGLFIHEMCMYLRAYTRGATATLCPTQLSTSASPPQRKRTGIVAEDKGMIARRSVKQKG